MHEAYHLWHTGDLTALQAARAIWSDLREIQSELAPLQAQERALRAYLDDIAARNDGKLIVPEFGTLTHLQPTTIASYTRERMDALVAQLAADSAALISKAEVVQLITACRKESTREGYLRIDQNQPKPLRF
jgi:hypothetical protein